MKKFIINIFVPHKRIYEKNVCAFLWPMVTEKYKKQGRASDVNYFDPMIYRSCPCSIAIILILRCTCLPLHTIGSVHGKPSHLHIKVEVAHSKKPFSERGGLNRRKA